MDLSKIVTNEKVTQFMPRGTCVSGTNSSGQDVSHKKPISTHTIILTYIR